jgi:hypothetical protein
VVDAVEDGKDLAAAKLGRKGGSARARSLISDQRAEIARQAARTRWKE